MRELKKLVNKLIIFIIAFTFSFAVNIKAGEVQRNYTPGDMKGCYANVNDQINALKPDSPYSCKGSNTMGGGRVSSDFIQSAIFPIVGIVGLATDIAVINNFNMTAKGNNNEDLDNEGKTDAAGVLRCNKFTDDIRFCYKLAGGEYSCAALKDGESTTLHGMMFRALNQADLLCVEYNAITWKRVGCKVRKDAATAVLTYRCYTALSCGERSEQNSRGFFPMTSGLVQCFDDSMESIFFSNCCANDKTSTKNNMLSNFQNSMRGIVRLLLTLYVISWGIKIALGGEMPRKGEVMMFGLKFILVIYFSVGFTDPVLSEGEACSEAHRMNDGITKYLIPGLKGLTNTLSSIMINAGGNGTLCKFDPSKYNSGYDYLALWDVLDCKFLYYLGIASKDGTMNFKTGIFSLFWGLLCSFSIVPAIIIILFSLFIAGMFMYFVHAYLIAKFGLVLLIYLAPLFVPMALFEQTKSFFQGWMKLAISFSLQPVVIVSFIALMLTIFDDVIFNNCTFNVNEVTGYGPTCKTYQVFTLTDSSVTNSDCNSSLGFFLINKDNIDSRYTKSDSDLVSLPKVNVNINISQLVTITVFSFLFFSFSQIIGQLAADLTGGAELGAKNLTSNLVKTGGGAILGGGKALGKTAMKLGVKAANMGRNRQEGE